jgi:hypothetical protein
MKKLIKIIAFGIVITASMFSTILAQSFKATVVGKVTDPSGAAIPGATVTITQNGTNFTQTTTTNDGGSYSIPQLQPGGYTIKIEAPGFKIAINTDVVLETDQTLRLDVNLEVGSVSETVTVQDAPSVINSETPEKGEVIVQKQVQELPLNVRDFTDLAKLVPGIYQRPTDDDQGQGLASAGTRTDSTNFILDGVANRSDRNGSVGVNTSVDSIQEFKVSTSTYSAELGRLAGAQISVVSKSGTNRYSGTAFEFIRNDFFDAKNALADPEDDKVLRRHQFGGTFGGPLPFFHFGEGGPIFDSGKDKTFFFVSFEQLREVRSLFFGNVLMPNASWVQGDFRNTGLDIRCISRNNTTGVATRVVCPTPNVFPQNDVVVGNSTILGISPIARQIAAFLPQTTNANGLDSYSILTNILPRNLFSVKIDRKLTDDNNFYFRVSTDNRDAYQPQAGRVLYPNFLRDLNYRQYSYAFGDTHAFRPTLVNEFRIGLLTQNNKTVNENNDVNYIGQLGISGLPTGQLPEWQGFPAIRIDGFPDTGDSANTPFNFKYKNLSIYDSLTWVFGDHNLKFGFDIVRPNYIETDIRNVRGDFRFRGRFTNPGNATANGPRSFADFLLGLPDSTQRQIGAEAADLTAWQSAFYIQDNWRVTPWLTLNLGLRYDYTPYLYEKTNRLSNFIPELGVSVCAGGEIRDTATNALICRDAASLGLPRSLVETDKNNLAPRFGFALKPFNNDKTVIRGGAGIFYSTETINPARQQLANNYPYLFREQYSRSSTANILQITLSNPFPSDRASLQGLTTPQGIPTNSQTPEIYQYNLTLERELTEDLGLEIGYVGSQGRFLGMRYNLNTALPVGVTNCNATTGFCTLTTARPLPAYGDITYQVQALNSSYNALQAVLRRRSKNGLTLLASYTFGKAMDQNSNTNNSTTGVQRGPQNILNWKDDWSLADYHRTHQFSGSFNYELPFGRGRKFFRDAKGWSQALLGDWQMNGILTMLSGRPFTPVFSSVDFASGRPDIVGDPLQNVPAGLFFNPAAFAHPHATNVERDLYGNSGRNILMGPDFRNLDLSLFKNIRFTEKTRLQLRWEVFNVLNRPNFQIPQHLLETTDTGRFRATSNEAREMQFAARIIF